MKATADVDLGPLSAARRRRSWLLPRVPLVLALGFLAAELVTAVRNPEGVLPIVGIDYEIYMDATRRWLADGSFYLPLQVTGPYPILLGVVLYPPNALILFVPFTFLPALLWWAIPITTVAFTAWSWRPSMLAWACIVACLTVPTSWWRIEAGNPLLWMVAALALGTRFGWPAVAVLLKPSLFPFAFVGVGQRSWWLALGFGVLLSLPFLDLWFDYARVLMNARGEPASILYSIGDIPLMLIPLIAWQGRTAATPADPRGLSQPPGNDRQEENRDVLE